MIPRRRWIAAVAGLGLIGAAGKRHPDRRAKTVPNVRCDIPAQDYIHGSPSQVGIAFSDPVVLVRTAGPPPAVVPVGAVSYAYYQLTRPSITIDQCSISQVVLTTWDNGSWSLDLRADQNPMVSQSNPQILPGSTGPTKVTSYIRRNLFTVRIRGLGSSSGPLDPANRIGRPVLFTLEPDPFWVQRGIPKLPSLQKESDPRVAKFFNQVDRIEVDFSYR